MAERAAKAPYASLMGISNAFVKLIKAYRFIGCHGEVSEGVLCVCKISKLEIIFRGLGSGNPRHTHLYLLRIK